MKRNTFWMTVLLICLGIAVLSSCKNNKQEAYIDENEMPRGHSAEVKGTYISFYELSDAGENKGLVQSIEITPGLDMDSLIQIQIQRLNFPYQVIVIPTDVQTIFTIANRNGEIIFYKTVPTDIVSDDIYEYFYNKHYPTAILAVNDITSALDYSFAMDDYIYVKPELKPMKQKLDSINKYTELFIPAF